MITADQAAYILRTLYEIWGRQNGLRLVEFEAAPKEDALALAGTQSEGK